MLIDIHAHVSFSKFPELIKKFNRKEFSAETLIKRMELEGIDKSVVLPLENPENTYIYGVGNNLDVIEAARRYPDKIIPFCNVDPRSILNTPKADLSKMIKAFKEMGCKGVGEICANIYIDSELARNLFYHCGKYNMPVLFHLTTQIGNTYGLVDDIKLPRLEKILKEFPETIFIGHAPAFWSEISADVNKKTRGGYPKSKIRRPGRLQELLSKYPNLYGDLSAGSGYNAITRDEEYGYKFLEEFNKKLLFGTDRFVPLGRRLPPQIKLFRKLLKEKKISKEAYENITYKNAKKLLGI